MFEVVFLDKVDRWLNAFRRLPSEWQDVHFHPGYYAAFAAPPVVEPGCAILDSPNALVLYPFLRCRIDDPALVAEEEQIYDIQGAPGYNGIASSTKDPLVLADFHQQFCAYCRENTIVAEMTRLNPALDNSAFSQGAMTIAVSNVNVIVDLTVPEVELWRKHYSQAARKQVNKGIRNGLSTRLAESETDIATFQAIFEHTMARNQAAPEAGRPLSFFRQLADTCAGNCLFFLAEHEGRTVAAELVTHGTTVAYSFLGGTLDEAFSLGANDFLKHDIIRMLRARGLRRFCLGGGLKPGDGIHRYKQKFSVHGGVDFRIGSRIHDADRFQRLVDDWSKAYPERSGRGAGKVLPYRF